MMESAFSYMEEKLSGRMAVIVIDIFELIHVKETEHAEPFLFHVLPYPVFAASPVAY